MGGAFCFEFRKKRSNDQSPLLHFKRRRSDPSSKHLDPTGRWNISAWHYDRRCEVAMDQQTHSGKFENMLELAIADTVKFRRLQENDSAEFHALVQANIDRLSVWCPWLDEVETIEKTRSYLRRKIDRFKAGDGLPAGLFESGILIGFIALEFIDKMNLTTEIGYWLDARVEGRGLVTAACRKLIDHSFGELKLERVQIRCAVENRRSRSIPERLGFTLEGVLRHRERLGDRTVDLAMYGMLASEWDSRRDRSAI
jgi:ribosomal-protein-serine acetyltransferase